MLLALAVQLVLAEMRNLALRSLLGMYFCFDNQHIKKKKKKKKKLVQFYLYGSICHSIMVRYFVLLNMRKHKFYNYYILMALVTCHICDYNNSDILNNCLYQNVANFISIENIGDLITFIICLHSFYL